MMIALPNPDRSFTCTLFWPNERPGGFAALDDPRRDLAALRRALPGRRAAVPDPGRRLPAQPGGLLGTVRAARGRSTAGSACSATPRTPSCRSTGRARTAPSRTSSSWTAASTRPAATGRRRCRCSRSGAAANTEAIAEMALANFVEMRDKVASPVFQLAARSSTRWSGRCPAGTSPGTSWCRSRPPRTPRWSPRRRSTEHWSGVRPPSASVRRRRLGQRSGRRRR